MSATWTPTEEFIRSTNLWWLIQRVGVTDYRQLHRWTVEHRTEFWDIVRDRLAYAAGNVAENCFRAAPDSPAIVAHAEDGGQRTVSVGDLDAGSGRVARALRARGIQPGDAVAVLLPMTVEAVVAYLGLVKAGAVAVCIADSFMTPEIAVRLQIGRAKWVVTQAHITRGGKRIPLAERVTGVETVMVEELVGGGGPESRPAGRSHTDWLNILFSSGTTGAPKAIPWTHETPLKCAMDAHFHHNLQPGDVVAWPTSLGWMMGAWLIFAALINRATIALYEGAPTEPDFGKFVQDARVTMLGVVPSLVKAWRAAGSMDRWDWSAIQCFSSTGECSNADDMAWLMARAGHKPVIEYCGGTEIGGGYITGTLVQPAFPGQFSTPALGLDFVILDEAGNETDNGEVFLVGPSVGLSTELLNADHHAIYCADVPRPGLRRHGDQIERLPNGYYRAHGRVDDTMKLSGIKTSSREIEECVAGIPGVREAAAVAVSPPGGGPSRLVIFAVGDATNWRAAMQHRLCERLNPLFKIHEVVPVDALPRTASNKVLRRELRQRYEQRYNSRDDRP
jgi:acetyl-CoA synthetase